MKITVLQKSNYGAPAFYPVCGLAKAFAAVAGTKTLTVSVLETLRKLGYEIEVTHEKMFT